MTQSDARGDASAANRLISGQRIGKYQVLEPVRRGGLPDAFKARDTLLERVVTLRCVWGPRAGGDERDVDLARREAQLLARFGGGHPNILAVYEILDQPEGLIVVMEYMPGYTLAAILNRQRLAMPLRPAVSVLWHVAHGLQATHGRGIIHRDLTPRAILVNRFFHAKLIDFRAAARAGGFDAMTLGTTKYQAPELQRGHPPDARTDIYSLGFITYEMLTGREFFDKHLFAAIARDAQNANVRWMRWHGDSASSLPPLDQINLQVPRDLASVIRRMVAKEPAERYGSIEALLADLRSVVGHLAPRIRNENLAAAEPAATPVLSPADTVAELESWFSDEDVDLESAGEPVVQTRRREPMLTRLVVGGMALILALTIIGTGLLYARARQVRLQAEAAGELSQAQTHLAGGEADAAEQRLREVTQEYGDVEIDGVPVRARAAAFERVIAARRALDGGDVAGAERELALADAALLPPESLALIRNRLDARRAADQRLDEIAALLDGGDFAVAQTRLDALEPGALPAELEGRLSDLRSRTAAMARQLQFESFLQAGDRALADGDFAEAERAYRAARDVLDREEVTRRLGELDLERRVALLLSQADQRADAGDVAGQIAALAEAAQVRPDPELRRRAALLEAEQAYQAHEAARQAGQFDQAALSLTEAIDRAATAAAEPGAADEAAAQLDVYRQAQQTLEADRHRAGILAEADAAVEAEQYDRALGLLDQAAEIRGGADVDLAGARIRWELQLRSGDAALGQQQWAQAAQAYTAAGELRGGDEAAAQIVRDRLAALEQHRRFFEMLDQGEQQMRAGEFGQAVETATRTIALGQSLGLATEQAEQLSRRARYQHAMLLGEQALLNEEYRLALAYFSQALSVMETDEVRQRIDQTQRRVQQEPQ